MLAYLFDERGRILLLHRAKPPNRGLYSPIGGKLEQHLGESPTGCAIREIREEAGIEVRADDLHLTGIVSECSYEGQGHWLLFCFEVTHPVRVERRQMNEGSLEWHALEGVLDLSIPETDRKVLWPAFLKHRGGFFMVHIDCTGPELTWSFEQARGQRCWRARLPRWAATSMEMHSGNRTACKKRARLFGRSKNRSYCWSSPPMTWGKTPVYSGNLVPSQKLGGAGCHERTHR